ncbi:MAG: hypothetical protein HYU59_01700 [Magnetospirillum gryphiswaldense]|nr:hypothetical protein [Magnetospirillum gryphiswaldense]
MDDLRLRALTAGADPVRCKGGPPLVDLDAGGAEVRDGFHEADRPDTIEVVSNEYLASVRPDLRHGIAQGNAKALHLGDQCGRAVRKQANAIPTHHRLFRLGHN